MKFFKDEVIELYKMYFEQMKVSEFESLSDIPDGVTLSEMNNLAAFIKNIKEANPDIDIRDYKIGDLVENFVYNNYTSLQAGLK